MIFSASYPTFCVEHAIMRDFGSVQELRRAFLRAAQHGENEGCIWLLIASDGTLHLTHTPSRHTVPRGFLLSRSDLSDNGRISFSHESDEEKSLRHWHTVDWQDVSRRYNLLMQRLPHYPAP